MFVGPTVLETLEAASEEEELHHSSQDIVTAGAWAGNKDMTLRERLNHLTPDRCEELASQLLKFPDVFRDSPELTPWAAHDIDVRHCKPIKLPPYRVNPTRQSVVDEEIAYNVGPRSYKARLE
ncbi:hypothetical protein Pcinc_008788 [Petrolisthes cinctipes]|uniref:Uncharacterized protein n=1 Tax=Petrolisthes cinctipes TaxID=88211 RepID=A0AAE1G8L0_PETCI|nr:hypothetical protein Pcinc_029619 [Petrolisthes cinctipes]KAK3887101.1 hypothetical protein Pcinc_008788 [Petrolisthes cinctipes]